jgi:hypothetical protein
MEIEILNMISSASISGYYDPSLKLVAVWFHNIGEDKPDLVAYLLPGMNWDFREIMSEESELFVDKEIITIKHSPIQVFGKDSEFDKVIRKVLGQLIDHAFNENEEISPRLKIMKKVLDNNSYNGL